MKYISITALIILILLTTKVTPASAQKKNYTIGPGDMLEISVWKDESLTREIIIPPDGVISFPLIGDIDAQDLTIPQLRKIITQKLNVFIKEVTVTVILLQANSLKASVVGKVNTPGQFSITMETTVMHILAMAGDLNPFASAGNILVLRHDKGKTTKLSFDYNEVKKGRNLEQNIFLQKGDLVVVP